MSLLWLRFDPWPSNFRMSPAWQKKKKNFFFLRLKLILLILLGGIFSILMLIGQIVNTFSQINSSFSFFGSHWSFDFYTWWLVGFCFILFFTSVLIYIKILGHLLLVSTSETLYPLLFSMWVDAVVFFLHTFVRVWFMWSPLYQYSLRDFLLWHNRLRIWYFLCRGKGSIPGLDPWHRSQLQLGFDPWTWNFHMPWMKQKKKKKKRKKKRLEFTSVKKSEIFNGPTIKSQILKYPISQCPFILF